MSVAEPSRRAMLGGILAAGAAPALAALPGQAASPAPVRCSAGSFSGTAEPDGVTAFRGIRYGRAERFQPAVAWRYPEPHRAEEFGPVCPQRGRYQPQDEDCLFLNIWATAPRRGGLRPVMLYIHGGAYSNGSVTDPLNDGQRLAARGDVVVVTVNHRLNALGYLYLAPFGPRFADSGNLGQLDLVLALRWVRDNIAAFGGDPNRVMLFGQSGGGAKIATLMGMPTAKGLFHRAATMSGQQVTASGPRHATERTRAVLGKLNVDPGDLSRLLTMPVEGIVDALGVDDPFVNGNVYMGPVLDMRSLDRHPFWPDPNPLGNSIPMILGNARDETRAFYAADSDKVRTLSWDNLGDRIAAEIPSDILPSFVVGEYRRREPGWSPQDIFYAATTAGRSWRGQVIEAEARARAGVPGWVYQVDFAARAGAARGAFHAIDIPLAFGTIDKASSPTGAGTEARAASQALQNAFVAFAATGNPNHPGLPHWPQYDLRRRATLIVDERPRIADDPRRWQRELFARVPYIQPGT